MVPSVLEPCLIVGIATSQALSKPENEPASSKNINSPALPRILSGSSLSDTPIICDLNPNATSAPFTFFLYPDCLCISLSINLGCVQAVLSSTKDIISQVFDNKPSPIRYCLSDANTKFLLFLIWK